MEKRGQFYAVLALGIAALIIIAGSIVVYGNAKESKDLKACIQEMAKKPVCSTLDCITETMAATKGCFKYSVKDQPINSPKTGKSYVYSLDVDSTLSGKTNILTVLNFQLNEGTANSGAGTLAQPKAAPVLSTKYSFICSPSNPKNFVETLPGELLKYSEGESLASTGLSYDCETVDFDGLIAS